MNRGLRLAAYRVCALQAFADSRITSAEISAFTGINATMVRRDMIGIQASGTRGVGYRPATLAAHLEKELKRIGWEDVLEEARAQLDLLKLIVPEVS